MSTVGLLRFRHAGQREFIRATPHQARDAQRLGLETRLDEAPRFSGQARLEWAREQTLLSMEMMHRAHAAAPDLYRYIGER